MPLDEEIMEAITAMTQQLSMQLAAQFAAAAPPPAAPAAASEVAKLYSLEEPSVTEWEHFVALINLHKTARNWDDAQTRRAIMSHMKGEAYTLTSHLNTANAPVGGAPNAPVQLLIDAIGDIFKSPRAVQMWKQKLVQEKQNGRDIGTYGQSLKKIYLMVNPDAANRIETEKALHDKFFAGLDDRPVRTTVMLRNLVDYTDIVREAQNAAAVFAMDNVLANGGDPTADPQLHQLNAANRATDEWRPKPGACFLCGSQHMAKDCGRYDYICKRLGAPGKSSSSKPSDSSSSRNRNRSTPYRSGRGRAGRTSGNRDNRNEGASAAKDRGRSGNQSNTNSSRTDQGN